MALSLTLLSVVSLGLPGCVGEFRSANSGVTTLPNFLSGNLVPMTTFTTSDVIRFYVCVTWDNVTQEPGWEDVVWNWYKDGKIVGHLEHARAYFKGAPSTRFATQPASALGVGHFQAECLINGKQIATAEFDIR